MGVVMFLEIGFHVDVLAINSPSEPRSVEGNTVNFFDSMLGQEHYQVVLAACFWEEAGSVVDYIKYEDTKFEQVIWAPLYDAIQIAELSGEEPCREVRSE